MAIQASDIVLRFTLPSATQGNVSPQPSSAASLGGWVSTTAWPGNGTLGDLLALFSGQDNAGLVAHYRCLAVYNTNPTNTWLGVQAYFSSLAVGGVTKALGVDPTAASAVGSTTQQGVKVANDESAPAGVTFSTPTSLGAAVALGDIGPGQVKFIWFKWTGNNSAPLTPDSWQLTLTGDTNA